MSQSKPVVLDPSSAMNMRVATTREHS